MAIAPPQPSAPTRAQAQTQTQEHTLPSSSSSSSSSSEVTGMARYRSQQSLYIHGLGNGNGNGNGNASGAIRTSQSLATKTARQQQQQAARRPGKAQLQHVHSNQREGSMLMGRSRASNNNTAAPRKSHIETGAPLTAPHLPSAPKAVAATATVTVAASAPELTVATAPLCVLPVELVSGIFEFCTTPTMLVMRQTNQRLSAIAASVMARRLAQPVRMLADTTRALEASHKALLAIKQPQLAHYRQFLAAGTTTTEIAEAAWYSVPPQELHTVCECLCILNGALGSAAGPAEAGPGRTPVAWTKLRRVMARFDFKAWAANLTETVAHISPENVRRVEAIIRMDPLITYERLREVSHTGYRLLIVVAACLQYVNIHKEVVASRSQCDVFERKFNRLYRFLVAVGGHAAAPSIKSASSRSSGSSGLSGSLRSETGSEGYAESLTAAEVFE